MTSKIMKKRKLVLLLIILVLLSVGLLTAYKPRITVNNIKLKKALTGVSDVERVSLDEVVPFKWDKVYTFAPYTSKEEIEETIGLSSSAITETVNEGMVQLIFVKGDKIVASVCGYAESLGYSVQFEDVVEYGEGTKFEVEYADNVIRFNVQ